MAVSKRIYIYSPSGAVRDKAAFRRGVQRLKLLGHSVEVDPDALASSQRFAGDDATRVAAVQRAADSGANLALITRGGYGLTRILQNLDYARMAKAVAAGMHFVGFSDFTALQLALLAQTRTVTWAGPALCEGFGALPEPDEIMESCFEDLLLGQGEGCGWRQLPGKGFVAAERVRDGWEAHNATLWGGNLSVLVSLLGTPYFPKPRSGVLFLEETGEHPYRIERMLTQLLLAGVLPRQKAIVMGQFTDYTLVPHDRGFDMNSVLARLQGALDIPVLTNLPFGHVPTKVLLPVGAKVDLACSGRDVLLAWGHIDKNE